MRIAGPCGKSLEMDEADQQVAEAERMLRRALQILSTGGRYVGEEWMLLAYLVAEADLLLGEARKHLPRLHVPLFDEVLSDLRDTTANFTNVDFLRSSRPARRRNATLFQTHR